MVFARINNVRFDKSGCKLMKVRHEDTNSDISNAINHINKLRWLLKHRIKKKVTIGLVLESLTKNDAIGNNFLKRKLVLDEMGFNTSPIVGYTNIWEFRDYQIFLRNILDILNYKSLKKLYSNPVKYLPRARSYINPFDAKKKIPDCDIYIIDFSSYSKIMEGIFKFKKAVKIVDFHDITPIEFVKDKILIDELNAAQKQVTLLKKADIILAHSQFVMDKIRRIHKNRNYKAPLSLFSSIPVKKQKKLRDKRTLRILFVGRISEHKGIHILIEALSKLSIEFECSIIGDYSHYFSENYYKRLKKRVSFLGIADKIRFLGSVSDEELKSEYKKADLFVTASLHEGFCIPIVEAMSYGIPVIGSNSSAIPSTIGKGGLCFATGNAEDLKNKILYLFNNRKKYSQLSREAIKEAGKHSDSSYFRFYEKLLRKFL